MEINPDAAIGLGIEQQSYVRLVSRRGDAIVLAQLTHRVPRIMVFVPFHYHDCVNRLTLGLLDPYSRQPAFKQCSVRIEPVDQQEAARLNLQLSQTREERVQLENRVEKLNQLSYCRSNSTST